MKRGLFILYLFLVGLVYIVLAWWWLRLALRKASEVEVEVVHHDHLVPVAVPCDKPHKEADEHHAHAAKV